MGLVRFFLALVVVAAHFQGTVIVPNKLRPLSQLFTAGFHSAYAVLFFYVISGFLISYTLIHNYESRPGGTAAFYRNRAVRIFAVYWPLLLISFYLLSATDFFAGNLLDKFTMIFLLGADWNMNFASFPLDNWNALPQGMHQAWTLGAELTFYLLAPFLIRRPRVLFALFCASALIRIGLVHYLGTHIVERWTYYFAPSTLLFFLGGQGICLLASKAEWLKNRRLGCALVALSFFIMLVTRDTGFDIKRLWISVTLFVVGLPGFFNATKDIRWMNAFGNLSYPIYLTHMLAVMFIGPPLYNFFAENGLARQPYTPLIVIAFLAIAALVGFMTHYALEIPVSYAMKTVLGWATSGTNAMWLRLLPAKRTLSAEPAP